MCAETERRDDGRKSSAAGFYLSRQSRRLTGELLANLYDFGLSSSSARADVQPRCCRVDGSAERAG